MKVLLLLLPVALTAACASQTPVPETSAPDLPNDPRIVIRPNPVQASMPSDCVRPDFVLDTTSPPSVPITRSQVEQRTDPLGDRPTPLAVVLGRVTMNLQDSRGDLIRSRPAWVVYRTGMMNRLPSGRPFSPGASPTSRPVYLSTASIAVVDATTGEGLWAMACGIVRAS